MEEYIYNIIKKFNDRDEIITRDALVDIFDHYEIKKKKMLKLDNINNI